MQTNITDETLTITCDHCLISEDVDLILDTITMSNVSRRRWRFAGVNNDSEAYRGEMRITGDTETLTRIDDALQATYPDE